jgi:3-methyladenine DNA glycosylase AlkD
MKKNLQAFVIQEELTAYSDPIKKEVLPRFFKTGKGEYGEGDCFLGVVVPHTRLIAKRHKDASLQTLDELLQSTWHECRLCALLMLVEQFRKANPLEQSQIIDFYLAHTDRMNNWDLVDLSAPYLLGAYLFDKSHDPLYRLADSTHLWEQRMAIVATIYFIRHGEYIDTMILSEHLLHHPHDLIRKAVGWMLREVGKRDKDLLIQFLEKHAAVMPRVMLRYAIEKFSPDERARFMKR